MQPFTQLILAALVFESIALSSTTSPPSRGELSRPAAARAIEALDRCVQDRFVRTDKGFGISRLSIRVHNTQVFVSMTDAENRAVHDFETLGMRVVMYVASRQRPRFGPFGAGSIPPLIQGPIFVNPAPRVSMRSLAGAPLSVESDPRLTTDLPDDTELRLHGVRALEASADREPSPFEVGSWKFVARPVRASASACLTCHNPRRASDAVEGPTNEPFRLGDALGAVLYGYQALGEQP